MQSITLPVRGAGHDECFLRQGESAYPMFFHATPQGIVVTWTVPAARDFHGIKTAPRVVERVVSADDFRARYMTRDEADAAAAEQAASAAAAEQARVAAITAERAAALRPFVGDHAEAMAWPPVDTPEKAASRFCRLHVENFAAVMAPIETRLARALHELGALQRDMEAAEEAVRRGHDWPLDFTEGQGDAREDALAGTIAGLIAKLQPGWQAMEKLTAQAAARWARVSDRVIPIILPAVAEDDRLDRIAKYGERFAKVLVAAERLAGSPTKREEWIYDRLLDGEALADILSAADLEAFEVYVRRTNDAFLRGYNAKYQGECCAEYVVRSTENMAQHGRYEDGHLLQRWKPSGDASTLRGLALATAARYDAARAWRKQNRIAAAEIAAKAEGLIAAQIAMARPA